MEDLRVFVDLLQDSGSAFPIGIAEEDLTEVMCVHQLDQLSDAIGIELVEYIVEEENGLTVRTSGEKVELCQFQGDKEAFLLSLTSVQAQFFSFNGPKQIVFVDAFLGSPRLKISFS